MKQTAVEKLVAHLIEYGFDLSAHKLEIEQAKEIEKQQLEKCAIHFTNYAIDTIEGKKEINGEKQFEQYYNETFNK